MSNIYYVNGTPMSFSELIRMAKEWGYKGDDGMYFTSGAARVLRNNGFEVTDQNPPGEEG